MSLISCDFIEFYLLIIRPLIVDNTSIVQICSGMFKDVNSRFAYLLTSEDPC